ncbi:MAG: YqeG family HAD IIIA-type phosphatase [Oscillospiraceae bacterium]
MLFNATTAVRTVDHISADLLNHYDIKGLILDLDNTLTTHDNPIPAERVEAWLEDMRRNNIKMMIVSNNHYERVKPFADNLKLDFVCEGKKPLSKGFKEAQKLMGIPFDNIAIVGDQIFTDILGANLIGVKSIYVFPIQHETTAFFKFKRFMEKPFIPKKLYDGEKR